MIKKRVGLGVFRFWGDLDNHQSGNNASSPQNKKAQELPQGMAAHYRLPRVALKKIRDLTPCVRKSSLAEKTKR